MIIVNGIRNSIQRELNLIILNEESTRLIEWPMVNAVININTFFQLLKLYKQASEAINIKWSSASK